MITQQQAEELKNLLSETSYSEFFNKAMEWGMMDDYRMVDFRNEFLDKQGNPGHNFHQRVNVYIDDITEKKVTEILEPPEEESIWAEDTTDDKPKGITSKQYIYGFVSLIIVLSSVVLGYFIYKHYYDIKRDKALKIAGFPFCTTSDKSEECFFTLVSMTHIYGVIERFPQLNLVSHTDILDEAKLGIQYYCDLCKQPEILKTAKKLGAYYSITGYYEINSNNISIPFEIIRMHDKKIMVLLI